MAYAIHTEHLQKSYGEHQAVKDMSFDVHEGEIFAMMGPNGAGKSTTIRMILDIIKPDAGKIEVLGGTLTDATKDRIGYLPEERGLYKNVPIGQLLGYLGQLKGMRRQDAENRAKSFLEQLDLGEHYKSKLTALSKGMAQKVQFIATILHRPQLIIIDEPFSGLDPVNTQILKDLLYRTAQEEGTAIVMSTHQMQQLQEMADRMLMIAKGERVLYGAVTDVRQQYAEHAVIVSGEGQWQTLQSAHSVTPQKDSYFVRLKDGLTPDDLMREIANGDYKLRHFELAVPSLEEIFIKVAGGTLDDLHSEDTRHE